jgi:hypothetical protein
MFRPTCVKASGSRCDADTDLKRENFAGKLKRLLFFNPIASCVKKHEKATVRNEQWFENPARHLIIGWALGASRFISHGLINYEPHRRYCRPTQCRQEPSV